MNGMHPSTPRPEQPEVNLAAPFLPHFGLNSLQVVCAIELTKGRKAVDIRKQFNISSQMWRSWEKNPRFTEHISAQLASRAAVVLDVLKEGELQAAAVLLGALGAEFPMKHKDGKIRMHADWPTRRAAADSFLNRAGERGKPIDRVLSKNTNNNVITNEVRSEISQALADPAVRAFLEADPAFAAKLREQMLLLGSGQEEPCATLPSESSPEPPQEPLSLPPSSASTEPDSPNPPTSPD